jgi:hypothetical protein
MRCLDTRRGDAPAALDRAAGWTFVDSIPRDVLSADGPLDGNAIDGTLMEPR